MKTQSTLQPMHIPLYMVVPASWLKCPDKAHEVKEFLGAKRSSTGGHDVERIVGHQIGPGRGEGALTAYTVPVEGPVFLPVDGTHDKVEFVPEQRVKRVGYPKRTVFNVTKRRS